MTNLKDVIEFIRGANSEEFYEIKQALEERKKAFSDWLAAQGAHTSTFTIVRGRLAIYVYRADALIAEYEALTHGGWIGSEIAYGSKRRFNGGAEFPSVKEVEAHIKAKYPEAKND